MQKTVADKISQKVIEISFYALLFITPFLMNQQNSEVFELPKMFFVWAMTTVITGTWIIRMVIQGRIIFQRTFLDIPLIIFLISQFLSFLFSIDQHTSFEGYYSRFNGGLLSLIAYSILYWAFVSNFTSRLWRGSLASLRSGPPAARFTLHALRFLLISALLVALWGIPAHFGRDPSCLIFMYNSKINLWGNISHNLNTDCWTAQFVPTVRIFSTLGQPNWLAAWLVALVPISWALALGKREGERGKGKEFIVLTSYFIIPALLLLALFYTRSQSGFAGLAAALIVLLAGIGILILKRNLLILGSVSVVVILLLAGTVFSNKFQGAISAVQSCSSIMFSKNAPVEFTDITPSWQIRCIVWKGAIKIWQNYPLFGTGPETFAYSYYQFRPPEHNLTSEWDFLYNKAHNEYLNTLANTGTIGLMSYLVLIISIFYLFYKLKVKNKQSLAFQAEKLKITIQNLKLESNQKLLTLNSNFSLFTLHFALFAGFTSILVTNFFGFSVVPVQLLFFLFPAIAIILNHNLSPSIEAPRAKSPRNLRPGSFGAQIRRSEFASLHPSVDNPRVSRRRTKPTAHNPLPILNLLIIVAVLIATFYILHSTFQYYLADLHYSKAERLANQDEYLQALPEIRTAIDIRPTEPLYQNELSNILSSLILLVPPEEQETKLKIAKLAKDASDLAVNTSPRNINFLRTRSIMFVRLSTVDETNLDRAAQTLEEAIKLAPTDPKLFYNLGFLYLQTEKYDQAKLYLSRALELRPQYQDVKTALEKLTELKK